MQQHLLTYIAALVFLFTSANSNAGKIFTEENPVIMYSASWCPTCKNARAYFEKHQIPWQEYDVENTDKGYDDFIAHKGKVVPLIFVNNKRLDGFTKERFEKLLLEE